VAMSCFVHFVLLLFVSGFDAMKCGGDALCFFVLFVNECDAINPVVKWNTRLQRAAMSFLFLPQSSLSHSHTVTCHNVSHWHIYYDIHHFPGR
jgi:hypothetical protein